MSVLRRAYRATGAFMWFYGAHGWQRIRVADHREVLFVWQSHAHQAAWSALWDTLIWIWWGEV